RVKSIITKIDGTLINTILLLDNLKKQVVYQRTGTKSKILRTKPVSAQGFIYKHQVLDCLLGFADAAGRFHTYHLAGLIVKVTDGSQHDQRDGLCCGGLYFTGGSFDKIGSGLHGQVARLAYILISLELSRFQDDF